jgi:hypothetical protein
MGENPTLKTRARQLALLDSATEMIKQFYEKVLPTQGVYGIGDSDSKQPRGKGWRNHYAKTLDEVYAIIEKIKSKGHDAYIALGTFENFSRVASNCIYHRSFFVDLDVGDEDKFKKGVGYLNKEDALTALNKFVSDAELPPPVLVDSGVGYHAYWPLIEHISAEEFLPYSEKFKALCIEKGLFIDPAATPADLARVLRFVGSFNHKTEPPSEVKIVSEEIYQYDFQSFKDYFNGELQELDTSPVDILALVPKGLDEDTKAFKKLDNFKESFSKIAVRSLEDNGCAQIADAIINSRTISRDKWAAVLTIAVHCEDGDEAIHELSKDYEKYDPDETYKTAHSFGGPRTCEWFEQNYPDKCNGCGHRGRITTPLILGRELRIATAPNQENPIRKQSSAQTLSELPGFLAPFVRGVNGGIYFTKPPSYDKKTKQKIESEPVLLFVNDIWPISRLHSRIDGECLVMRVTFPHDEPREFLLPINQGAEDLRKAVVANGALCVPNLAPLVSEYITKWGIYMQSISSAVDMRMQLGWTEDRNAFVIGSKEIRRDGSVRVSAPSPYIKGLSKHLHESGTYEKWRWCVDWLDKPGLEIQAFGLLVGFGSPLMSLTSTPGATVCLQGESGSAKSGSLYAALSLFGNPRDLSVYDATDNAMTGRYLALHSLTFGADDVGNKMKPEACISLVHKVSQGKAKLRMQASVNAEREYELMASLLALWTSNQDIYQKFSINNSNTDGEVARIIQFTKVDAPSWLKYNSALGTEIFDPLNHNYGFAGPMYVKELMRLGDLEVRARIEKWEKRFIEDFGSIAAYRFYNNAIAVSFAGGEIANNAGIINIDLERVYNKVVEALVNIRDNVAPLNRPDYPSMLSDFLGKNIQSVLVVEGKEVRMEPRGSLVARVDIEAGTLQVSKTEFRKYLATIQVSSANFEREMKYMFMDLEKKKPCLIEVKKTRLSSGWKHGLQLPPVSCYVFNTEIDDELFTMTDDTKSDS